MISGAAFVAKRRLAQRVARARRKSIMVLLHQCLLPAAPRRLIVARAEGTRSSTIRATCAELRCYAGATQVRPV